MTISRSAVLRLPGDVSVSVKTSATSRLSCMALLREGWCLRCSALTSTEFVGLKPGHLAYVALPKIRRRAEILRRALACYHSSSDIQSGQFGRYKFRRDKIHTSPTYLPREIDLLRMLYLLDREKAHAPFALVYLLVTAMVMVIFFRAVAYSQTETLDENSSDPVRLFERGQSAHARGDLEKALEFYQEALKVRPEFPEAEFQRANALVGLKRFPEAEQAFRSAIQLRPKWSLPELNLASLLIRLEKDQDAAVLLRQVLTREPENHSALGQLAELRLRAGDSKEALALASKATKSNQAPLSVWIVRAMAERAVGARVEANESLNHVLANEPNNVPALMERAEVFLDASNYEAAINDLSAAKQLTPGVDKAISSRLAYAYEKNGNPDEARRVAEEAGLLTLPAEPTSNGSVTGSPEEIAAANSEDPSIARKALLSLIEKNPKSAMLLARLGASYRTEDPDRSLYYYRRASELQPQNVEYAIGYASALVQARRFVDAVRILRSVLSVEPDNYTAHANLATALYAVKDYPAALDQYRWIVEHRPEAVIALFFIATVHDNLGEFQEALTAYESFLAKADLQKNQLEIEKVKLRLPTLKRQIELGQGKKRKASDKSTRVQKRP